MDAASGDISDRETGTWLLTQELYVEDGVTLQVCVLLCHIFRGLLKWEVLLKRERACAGDHLYYVLRHMWHPPPSVMYKRGSPRKEGSPPL